MRNSFISTGIQPYSLTIDCFYFWNHLETSFIYVSRVTVCHFTKNLTIVILSAASTSTVPNFAVIWNDDQKAFSKESSGFEEKCCFLQERRFGNAAKSMPPKFVCSKCGLFDFPRLDALHSHIVLVHFSNHHATYECLMSSCPARFLTELCMLTHVMEVHKARNLDSQTQKEIPIRTDIYQRLDESINMSFSQSSLPPTFLCSICCESGFPRLDALHSHIVLEHYNSPRATYECLDSSCPVLFATEFCMLRHVRKKHQPGNPKSPVETKISLRLLTYQCLNKSVNLSFEKCSEQVSSTRLSQCCVFPLTGSDLTADPPESNGTSKSFEPSNDPAIKSEAGVDLCANTSNTYSPKETVIKEEPFWLEEMANELELPGLSAQSTAHPSIPINSRQPDASVAKTMDKELRLQLHTSSSWPDVKDELDDYFMSSNTDDRDKANFGGSSNSTFPSSHPCANNASDAPTFEPSIVSTVKSEPGVDLGSKTSNTDPSKEPVIKDEPSLLEEMANELELPGSSFAGSSNSTFPSSLPFFHSFSTDSSNVRTWNVNSAPDSNKFIQTAIMGERISDIVNLRQDINSKFVSSSQDDIRYLTPNNEHQNRRRVEYKNKNEHKRQLVINYSGTGNSVSRTSIYHCNRKRRNFLTSEERQMIIDYSEVGHSTTEIGALLKRNPRFVRKVLTEHRKTKSEEKKSTAPLPNPKKSRKQNFSDLDAEDNELTVPVTSSSLPAVEESDHISPGSSKCSSKSPFRSSHQELIKHQISSRVPIMQEEHALLSNTMEKCIGSIPDSTTQRTEPIAVNHHENVADLRKNIMPSRIMTRSAQKKIFLHTEKDPFGGEKRTPAQPTSSKTCPIEANDRLVSSTGQILISPKTDVKEEKPRGKKTLKEKPQPSPAASRKASNNAYKIGLNVSKTNLPSLEAKPQPNVKQTTPFLVDSSLIKTKDMEPIQPQTSSCMPIIQQRASCFFAPDGNGKWDIVDSTNPIVRSCDPCSSYGGATNLISIPQNLRTQKLAKYTALAKKKQVERSLAKSTVPSDKPSAPKKSRRKQDLSADTEASSSSSARRNTIFLQKNVPIVGERDALANFTVGEFLRLKFYKF